MWMSRISHLLDIKKSPGTAIPSLAAACVAGATATALPIAIRKTGDAFDIADAFSVPGMAFGAGGAVIAAGLVALFVRGALNKKKAGFGYEHMRAGYAFMAAPLVAASSAWVLYLSSRLFAESHAQGAWEMLKGILG